jgi:Dolichyl-phosphate-mannose-protein mannosyltransferase
MTDILRHKYFFFGLLAVFIGGYLFMGTSHLNMPGLYYDECIFVNAATGGTSGPFIHKVFLGVPVMIMSYIGALKSFLYYPVFYFFGVSPITIRLPIVLLSSVTIIVSYLLGKRIFGRFGALLLSGLIATDPAFIYNVRLDFGPVAIMLLLKMLALYSFFEFLATHRSRFAWFLFLTLILGFYDKLNFIWFIGAFVISAGLLYGRELRALFLGNRKTLSIPLMLSLMCLTLGGFVLVIPALSNPSGLPLQSTWTKIIYVADIFSSTINGSWPFTAVLNIDQIPRTFTNFLFIPVVAAVLLSLWFRSSKISCGERKVEGKVMWFFIVMFAIIFIEIVMTKQGGGPHHLMMLYPIHYLILFSGARLLLQYMPERLTVPRVTGCLLVYLVIVTGQLYADYKYITAFREGRLFTPAWDPAIYRLSTLLETRGSDSVVCADWGVQTQLFSLASPANRIRYTEGSGILKRVDPNDPAGAEFLLQRMFQGRKTSVVLMGKDTGMAQESGRNFMQLYKNRLPPAVFHEKIMSADGKELYEVFGISGQ